MLRQIKKEPLNKWKREHKKLYTITGMTRGEGGSRNNLPCISVTTKKFNPLTPITKDWEKWFIEKYNVRICDIYKPPYNFERTGCKGCPYNLNLQKDLEIMGDFFPNEYKQCETIWKPVYDEYRRIGYRLK